MSIQSNFPSIKPSLLLDFANTKKLDSRVTFTRSTTATYYDGVTTAKAEENLFISSQEFDGGNWTKTATTVTANAATAPDGTSTADQMIETADTSNHRIQQNISAVNGFTYAISIFAKKGVLASARNFIQLAVPTTPFGVNAYANFDILNGTIPTQGAGLVSAAITNVGSGWYRCSIVVTATSTITAAAWIQIAQSGTDAILPSYAGSTSADVLLWGAQVEQRSSVTAYTATTTQAITNYIPVLQTAASGVPRFDHNPTTDESLGLLIEEQRTNICLQSEDFSTTWTNQESTEEVNVAIAPSGTLTADKLIPTTANDSHWISQSVTTTAAAHTFSFYAKAAGYSIVQVLNGTDATDRINFDLSNGTVGSATTYTGTITAVGNGWYRCTATYTTSATTGAWARIGIVPSSTSARGAAFAGDGFSGVFLWGAQLEAGAVATSYIPTVASTVTRNADVASMTGTNFSSWFSNAEGTFFGEASSIQAGSFSTIYDAQEGSNQERITQYAGTHSRFIIIDGGVTQVLISTGFAATNTFTKNAAAYRVNDFAASRNGEAAITDTSGSIPTVDRIFFGSRIAQGEFLNGTIRKIAYYPLRVTNAQLQALTS